MARRRTLKDATIAALRPDHRPNPLPDPELTGHYVRIGRKGKTFAAVARAPSGKQIWHTIGSASIYSIAEARERAREAIKAIREGRDRDGAESFETVAEAWFKRHVQAKGLITARELRSTLDRHLIPAWRGRDFATIRRGDVAKLLDAIEDSNGPVVADFVLAVVRMICNWQQTGNEDYVSPVVKGMRRTNPKARARARILDDAEIREVWGVAEANGTFGAFIRVALLIAQRRDKILGMEWGDIVDGEWRIPSKDREKGTAGSLVLPEAALAIINAQPRLASNPYVFAGTGGGYIQGLSDRKAGFDAKLKGVSPYVMHDLRRTARSLMSRVDVRPEVAERVLGHVQQGVEGVYNRYDYREEKAEALRALAGLIENIIRGDVDKVLSIELQING
jgi:integrase